MSTQESPQTLKTHKNSGRQDGDMNQAPQWRSTDTGRHRTKLSRHVATTTWRPGPLHPCPILNSSSALCQSDCISLGLFFSLNILGRKWIQAVVAITWPNSRNPRRISEQSVSGREIRHENTSQKYPIYYYTVQLRPPFLTTYSRRSDADAVIHHEWTWQQKAMTSAEVSPGFSGYCTKTKLSFRQKFLTKLLSAGLWHGTVW